MIAKQVIIFGAGPTGARVYDKYREFVDIVAITDNDGTKWGSVLGEWMLFHQRLLYR